LTGARLAAPSLLDYELAKICLTKIRRQPSQREALRAALLLVDRLRVETVAVDHAAMPNLAEATGLTAYDASYLWLARSLGGELVTLDRKLAAASARRPQRLAHPHRRRRRQIGGVRRSRFMPRWRAGADDDEHYVYTVALS
jgi:predicted nucleic acid-binding protein